MFTPKVNEANSKRVTEKLVLLSLAIMLAVSLTTTMSSGMVFAAPPSGETPGHSEGHGTPREDPGQPDDPDCWGEVTSEFTQFDDGQPGIGDHASSFGEPRKGVGNQDEDTPPEHGATVGLIVGGCQADRND
jgi:hypothetical protein